MFDIDSNVKRYSTYLILSVALLLPKISICYLIIMISFPAASFLTKVLVDLSMQEWAETVGGASLLDTLFKALDEVWFL